MNFKFLKDKEIIYDLFIEKYIDRNNKLTFMIDKFKCTFEIKENGCIFIREDNEYKFILDTINNECMLELKELKKIFDIKINSVSYKAIDNKLILKYNIETDESSNYIEIIRGV